MSDIKTNENGIVIDVGEVPYAALCLQDVASTLRERERIIGIIESHYLDCEKEREYAAQGMSYLTAGAADQRMLACRQVIAAIREDTNE